MNVHESLPSATGSNEFSIVHLERESQDEYRKLSCLWR